MTCWLTDSNNIKFVNDFYTGDFAYDFFRDNGSVGDQFMRQIESAAAYVPYMACPGNHEQK